MKSKSFYWIIIIISIIVIFYNLSYISFCREGYAPAPGEINLYYGQPDYGPNYRLFKKITGKKKNKKAKKLAKQINISKKIREIFNFAILNSIDSIEKNKKKKAKFEKYYKEFCKVGYGKNNNRTKCKNYFTDYIAEIEEYLKNNNSTSLGIGSG